MPKDKVRLGGWAAFWGDTSFAARQLLDDTQPLDYLVSDYLAEITMALLARARAKDPEAGFVPDALSVIAPLLPEIAERGIKVVTNAGALNPAALAIAFSKAAQEAGVDLKVAHVEGDDLLGRVDDIAASKPADMFTGEPFPAKPVTMNAYLGARPIATALDMGADIVITGRVVDSAVVLGPLMHEFGWSDDDYDLLSAGSLAGHLIECGPQVTGGLFTDWQDVPGWDDMGFPIAECEPDGAVTITKPEGTGGLVVPGSVAEQLLYEIGDPGAYLLPDVTCDWRDVKLVQDGENRVRATGAKGAAPTTTYKSTVTHTDGFRAMTSFMFAGVDAAGRARRAGEAVIKRTNRLLEQSGMEPLAEASVEVVGLGAMPGSWGADDSGTEAVVKVGVRHPDKDALALFGKEVVPIGLVAQGATGMFAGRPRPAPVMKVFHLLADKADVEAAVVLDGDRHVIEVAPGEPGKRGTEPLPEGDTPGTPYDAISVPLRRLAYGRSGDKGNTANIGLMARKPEYYEYIRDQVTAGRVAERFAAYEPGTIRRWEMPGLPAINIHIDDVLGGAGGTSTLRYDPQGKSYAAQLLDLPVAVPGDLFG